ncbi:phenylacetic acid degradation-related protein [Tieghemostelium lacteum]|uniref:Phenylacetic acid degradation-related protein n=1 Tax=Tieghemostelium lacteum TaxID=361077 RepID=A0A152A5W6_TIELA|nr:phenylacetic acid degradation-related protein [Tieghemostelium lacteum]|eukprot:KYR01626.1 phenylacetic acid degradation-related protein [Tieghemostelium lacteum]
MLKTFGFLISRGSLLGCLNRSTRFYSSSTTTSIPDIGDKGNDMIAMAKDMQSLLKYKDEKGIVFSDKEWFNVLSKRAVAGLPKHMGFEVVDINSAKGELTATMVVTDNQMAANGYVHAASLTTLADTACGFSCFTNLPKGSSGFTTVEMKLNFIGTATVGDKLTCVSKLIHSGKSTQVYDASIYNKDKLITLFRCTEMILYPTIKNNNK